MQNNLIIKLTLANVVSCTKTRYLQIIQIFFGVLAHFKGHPSVRMGDSFTHFIPNTRPLLSPLLKREHRLCHRPFDELQATREGGRGGTEQNVPHTVSGNSMRL